MRLIAIAGFGLGALGLFTIFNSTRSPNQLRRLYYVHRGFSARCPVIADRIVSRGQGHSENSRECRPSALVGQNELIA
jgi:hypothetical protein